MTTLTDIEHAMTGGLLGVKNSYIMGGTVWATINKMHITGIEVGIHHRDDVFQVYAKIRESSTRPELASIAECETLDDCIYAINKALPKLVTDKMANIFVDSLSLHLRESAKIENVIREKKFANYIITIPVSNHDLHHTITLTCNYTGKGCTVTYQLWNISNGNKTLKTYTVEAKTAEQTSSLFLDAIENMLKIRQIANNDRPDDLRQNTLQRYNAILNV